MAVSVIWGLAANSIPPETPDVSLAGTLSFADSFNQDVKSDYVWLGIGGQRMDLPWMLQTIWNSYKYSDEHLHKDSSSEI